MVMYNFQRFSQYDELKAISRKNLLALLKPYRYFLSSHGVTLPSKAEAKSFDYESLDRVLVMPDSDTPASLANALFLIHEMARPEKMADLLDEVERYGIQLEFTTDQTIVDVATQVWLQDKTILERKYEEQFRRRSIKDFQAESTSIPTFTACDQIINFENVVDIPAC